MRACTNPNAREEMVMGSLGNILCKKSGTILSILNSATYIVRVVGMTILFVLIVNFQL